MIDLSTDAGLLGSLGIPTLTVNVSGGLGSTPSISDVDVRASWKGGRRYLPSVVPIQTNMASSAFNLNTKLKLGQIEVEVGAGSDSTSTGFDRSFYEQLYTVGKANADLTYSGFFTVLNDPTVDWGSLDDPKIVVVQVGLQISSALLAHFSGAGLLIIDGGLLNLTAGNFTWDGLIIVRGPVLNVQLGTGTTVHGGLVMLDKPIICLPIIGCLPPPVSPVLKLFTDTKIMYSGETVAKLGQRLSMIRGETQVFVTHQQETATTLTFN